MSTAQVRYNRSKVLALVLAITTLVALSVILARQIRSSSVDASDTGPNTQPARFEVHYDSITDEELLAADESAVRGQQVAPVRYDFGFPSGLDEELLASR